MGKVTKYPHGTFSWMDGQTTHVDEDKAFYNAVLGWEYNDIPMGDGEFYYMATKNGENVAGFGKMQADMQAGGVPSHWNAYIAVDDVDAITEKADELGATVIMPPMDVFDSGRMSVVTDPTGANIAFWQANNHIGASLVNEDGALVWNELLTGDIEKSKKFYANLLDWEYQKMDMESMDYWLIKNNGRMNGGIMGKPQGMEEIPPVWMNYIHVDNLDSAIEKVRANGGKIMGEPVDTGESGPGKMALITAPSGAIFQLIQSTTVDEWVE